MGTVFGGAIFLVCVALGLGAVLYPLRVRLPRGFLVDRAGQVGDPQVRHRGTIGGNLGTASPAGDALPPLLVEDGEEAAEW